MDQVVKTLSPISARQVARGLQGHANVRPSREEAEAAVRVLLRWAGDDPTREGLLDTPARVARSYRELFAGYATDPRAYMERTFEEVGGYDELVVLRDLDAVQVARACGDSDVQAPATAAEASVAPVMPGPAPAPANARTSATASPGSLGSGVGGVAKFARLQ